MNSTHIILPVENFREEKYPSPNKESGSILALQISSMCFSGKDPQDKCPRQSLLIANGPCIKQVFLGLSICKSNSTHPSTHVCLGYTWEPALFCSYSQPQPSVPLTLRGFCHPRPLIPETPGGGTVLALSEIILTAFTYPCADLSLMPHSEVYKEQQNSGHQGRSHSPALGSCAVTEA